MVASEKVASVTPFLENRSLQPRLSSERSTKPTVSGLDQSMTLRDLKPKLERAVTETLRSYGIENDGMIDTCKMARMHKPESMLHT